MKVKLTRDTGKVLISSKWEDPTLSSPILRQLPRGTHLSVAPEPQNPLRDSTNWILAITGLFYLLVLCQALGWLL